MLFNSFHFVFFFILTTLVYFSLPHKYRWAFLLAISCYFYAVFVPIYILVMLYETLGEAWMTNEWFRFGASSLANDVIMQLGKEKLGRYYSSDYISKD